MKRINLYLVALLLLAIGLSACSSQTSGSSAGDLAGTEWVVTQIGPFDDVEGITAEFLDNSNQVKGNAGCNDYTVDYVSEGENFAFSNFLTTRMTCPDPTVLKMEQEYQLALLAVQSYVQTDAGLDFYSGDGELIIHYEPN